jgi:hypothetical protein
MATRAIVTSQPVLACGMCARRLLRGEQPEVFLAGGEPRTVCELCAPRAAQEGWVRESEARSSLVVRPSRRRRGGSLLGRLRGLREPPGAEPGPGPGPTLPAREDRPAEPDLSDEALDGLLDARETPDRGGVQADRYEPAPAPGLARAVKIFNGGEHPRRVSGVARSLGAPAVTVRPVEASPHRFTIVVAWELCWYRYEVDLEDEPGGARLLEKGMELDELPAEDRAPNALADARGELALAVSSTVE